jgi:hypothetical protein
MKFAANSRRYNWLLRANCVFLINGVDHVCYWDDTNASQLEHVNCSVRRVRVAANPKTLRLGVVLDYTHQDVSTESVMTVPTA